MCRMNGVCESAEDVEDVDDVEFDRDSPGAPARCAELGAVWSSAFLALVCCSCATSSLWAPLADMSPFSASPASRGGSTNGRCGRTVELRKGVN